MGVVFGVGFFICGQAQTQGFQTYFINTILGSKGAILISDRFQDSYPALIEKKGEALMSVNNQQSRKYYPGINDAQRIMRVLLDYPNVRAATPIVEKNVVLRAGFRSEVAVLQGIELIPHLQATDFANQLTKGTLEDFRDNPDAIAIGSLLEEKLELQLGQNIYLVGPAGDTRRFKMTNVYETGVNTIDEKRIYSHRRAAQSTLQEPFLTSFILVQLKNPQRAPADALAFEGLIKHRSRSWQEREKGNLQLFQALRVSAAIGVSAIIMLAGFGIFNILTMSVLDKTKEISILRSMGYTQSDISQIFVYQGFLIAAIGIVLGWICGAGLTYAISQIPIQIRGIFKTDRFIVEWAWEHYALAAGLALLSVFVASYLPARRAAQVRPVDILRGTSN